MIPIDRFERNLFCKFAAAALNGLLCSGLYKNLSEIPEMAFTQAEIMMIEYYKHKLP